MRQINLNTLLIKYYNDYVDKQSYGTDKGEVIYFKVGGIFCNAIGSKYTNFQQKIWLDTNCGTSQTSHCSNFATMEFLRHSTACVECDFLLKIGKLRPKGIIKNAPNFEVRDLTLVRSTTLFINVVIVVLY